MQKARFILHTIELFIFSEKIQRQELKKTFNIIMTLVMIFIWSGGDGGGWVVLKGMGCVGLDGWDGVSVCTCDVCDVCIHIFINYFIN